MQSIFNLLLKSISIILWVIFMYLMFLLAVGVVALIGNYDALSSDKSFSMPAVMGTALSPGFTAIFLYVIARFTWRWGGGTNNDLSLIEKMKISLRVISNK